MEEVGLPKHATGKRRSRVPSGIHPLAMPLKRTLTAKGRGVNLLEGGFVLNRK